MINKRSTLQRLAMLAGLLATTSSVSLLAGPQPMHPRHIVVNLGSVAGPLDRFFDLSVGSDFPGTLMRGDSQAQLKIVADELGFRYVRFHAIFHDVLGTVSRENGALSYSWSKIDQLYDELLAL